MSKRILILTGVPDFSYDNPMSAVALFLNEIKTAFETEYDVVDFPFLAEKKAPVEHQTPASKSGWTGKLKKILRKSPWVYHSLAYRGYFKRQELELEKLKKQKPYDHVITFHTAGAQLGQAIAKYWGCSLSVVFDAPTEEQFLEMHNTRSIHWSRILKAEQMTLEQADEVMVYSSACKEYIEQRYAMNARITILPCIVSKPSTENQGSPAEKQLLFIGSFLSWHRVSLLVYVFYELLKKYPNTQLNLVGYGEEWNAVKNQVDALGINQYVNMPGFVSEEELLQYKKEADVAVMPGSNWYGSPLKLVEYAQSTIPFIAPPTPTVEDIFIAEEHCKMISKKDPGSSLLEHLVWMLENKEEARQMAVRSKNYIQENFEGHQYRKKLFTALRPEN